ncbi:8359_t:CDS:2 [Entrophospora sp. SA101]|nr:8359_t:CDS:2 [Entrophospora sp. SA101]CAJ0853756.1 9474_t:CDS:2 [Entrophospora sp. SA101]CAJ0912359.1 9551_t:CDS:2 [Entrophospora sp. SA101]
MCKLSSFCSKKIHDEKLPLKCSKDDIVNINDDNKSLSSTLNDQDINNDPKNWSIWRKRIILLVVSFAAMTSPISSSILYPTLLKLRTEFNASDIEVNTLVSVYVYIMGIAPLGWAAYSDRFSSRTNVYFTSIPIFILSSILCAISTNLWLLLLGRGLQSFGASAMLSIGAGVISDLYISTERGTAYGFFYMAYWTGPLLGPMIGGYFTEYTNWRWIFWFLTILGGINLLLVKIFVPETFFSHDPSKSTPEVKRRFNPLAPLKLLRYPGGTLMIIYISIVSSIIQLQFVSVPVNFTIRYHLTSSQIGLLFFVPGFGFMIGSFIGGRYSDYVMKQAKKKNGTTHPKSRIHSAWISAVLVPTSYLIYGWLVEKEVHMAGPLIAWFFASFGTQVIYNSMSTYLVDVFTGQSASIIALNNFVRMTAAGTLSISSSLMEKQLGTGLMFTLLSGICFASISLLVLVYIKGKTWQEQLKV